MKKLHLLLLSICILSLAGCASSPVQRFGSVTGLNPRKAAYYEQLHAHPWPAVCAEIRRSHIRNYSIYLKRIEGKDYLFSYFEYTGRDFKADMAKMAADPETRRWWRETDPCQVPLPDARAKGKIWSDATPVFHLD